MIEATLQLVTNPRRWRFELARAETAMQPSIMLRPAAGMPTPTRDVA